MPPEITKELTAHSLFQAITCRTRKKEGWKTLWSRYPVSASASGAPDFVDKSPNAGGITPMVSPQSGDSYTRQPATESKFGKVFTQFHHNAKDAISKLKQEKSGDAVGALYHPEVGDIDLVWGNEGTAEQDYKDGMGLAKIAIKHPEVMDNLQDIISSMQIIQEKERTGYLHLESKDHVAKVRLDWNRESKKWLLTAFEKGARRGTTADTAEQSSEDDTARLTSSPDLNIRQPTGEIKPQSDNKPTDPLSQMAASVESLAKSVQALVENQGKATGDAPKFVRRGDFWNYSGSHVAEIAKALDLTVTSRDGANIIGIPDHARIDMEQQLREAGINAEFEADVYKKSENVYTSKERVKKEEKIYMKEFMVNQLPNSNTPSHLR